MIILANMSTTCYNLSNWYIMLTAAQTLNFARNLETLHESPLMLVDSSILTRNCRTFRDLFPNIALFYAYKSSASTDVVSKIDSYVDGYDVASVTEIETLLRCGVTADRMTYSNPVKESQAINRAAELGIQNFAFQSEAELNKIAAQAPGSSVYFRMDVSGAKGSIDFSAKFGADYHDSVILYLKAVELGLQPIGITFHVGSQANDTTAWIKAIERATMVVQMALDAGIKLKVMNIGGGFPVEYTAGTVPIHELAVSINTAIDQVRAQYPDLRIIAEPGRFITAESAVIVSTIIGKETRGGKPWLFIDTGTFQSFIEIFEFGKFFYPVIAEKHIGQPLGSYQLQNYALTGPTCDSYDTMTQNIELPDDLEVGDRLMITMAGAYTLVYGSEFNGFALPKIVFIDESTTSEDKLTAPHDQTTASARNVG